MYISPGQGPDERSATVWERVEAQAEVDELLRSRAVIELKRRLQHWHGDYLPRPSRFRNKKAIDRGTHPVVPADPVELVIARAVAMTRGTAQFGVSPNGAIFTAEGDGWTIRGPRVDVTRLCWLLDEAADILQQIRHGRGGRFYERNGRFFLADGRTTIMEVVDEADPAIQAEAAAARLGTNLPWWQRAVNAVLGRGESAVSASPTRNVSDVPEEIRRARRAPLRRRAEAVTADLRVEGQTPSRRSPKNTAGRAQICPVHFILLPANGRCDECWTD